MQIYVVTELKRNYKLKERDNKVACEVACLLTQASWKHVHLSNLQDKKGWHLQTECLVMHYN